jgi:hypothetical protein
LDFPSGDQQVDTLEGCPIMPDKVKDGLIQAWRTR